MKHAVLFMLMFAGTATSAQHRSYAGQQDREIKALSTDEVKQYLSGAGMGFARPAELNLFPGPMHMLELADKLGLTPEQRVLTKALMDAHRAEARAIGAMRVESERAIEMLFRSGKVNETTLEKGVKEAAVLEGEYRMTHLETHRRMRALLSDEQVARYAQLRGYEGGGEPWRRH